MSGPAVTVVLPTFDRLEFLSSAVQSVFAQTMRDWELVVADDGSGQEVRDYLDALNDDARVCTISLAHTGNPGKARNAAIAVARAPYIAFLDSDDLWEPRKLEQQLAVMLAKHGFPWSFTAFTIIDDEGKPLAAERNRRWTTYRGQVFEQIVRDPASVRTPTVVVSTQLVRDVGGFDEAIDCSEDSDLWVRLALRSPACIVGESLAHIRYHAGNRNRDVSRPYAARDYSLCKLTQCASGAQRALLERERALNAMLWANEVAARGLRWRCLATVGKSLLFSWRYGRWWYGSAKALARACFPSGSSTVRT